MNEWYIFSECIELCYIFHVAWNSRRLEKQACKWANAYRLTLITVYIVESGGQLACKNTY